LALAMAGCGARTLHAADPTAPPAVGPDATPVPVPAASPATALTEFSAVVNGRLLLPGGARINLAGIKGDVSGARETVDGWLIDERLDAEHVSLWLVRPDKSVRRLLSGAGGIAVAPDGRRIAWRDGDILRTGHLTLTGKVERERSTPAPKRGAPVFYTGEAVVLGYSETGGGWDRRDVWIPANGRYVPSWNANDKVRAVYGIAPDGRSMLGLSAGAAGSKSSCLAMLDPRADLAPTRTACLPVELVDHFGRVSPQGRWLAVGAFGKDGATGVAVIDLKKVFDHPAVATMWVGEMGGDWLDARTFITAQGAAPVRLTRFTVGKAKGEPVRLSGVPDTEFPTMVRTLA
jgi:hypothetical protein